MTIKEAESLIARLRETEEWLHRCLSDEPDSIEIADDLDRIATQIGEVEDVSRQARRDRAIHRVSNRRPDCSKGKRNASI